jgi:hypothetical protein
MPHPSSGKTTAASPRTVAARALAALAILAGVAGASGCAAEAAASADPPAGATRAGDTRPAQGPATLSPPSQSPPTRSQPSLGAPGRNDPGEADDRPAGGTDDLAAGGGTTFPDTATAYADEVVTAWQAGDLDRLGQLTSAQVLEQLMEVPALPALGWTDPWCDGTAGSSYCVQYSQPTPDSIGSGASLTLRIRHELLGHAGAAVEATYAALDFDTAWEDYVLDFISAWHGGDYDRLRQLAVPDVVSYAVTTAPPIHPLLAPAGGGGGLLQVAVTNDAGFQLQLDIGTTKLGGPQAIVGHTP